MAEEGKDSGLLAVGGKFGAYDVLKLLGRGGMGEVYLLRSPTDGEFYACKLMFPPSERDGARQAYEWRRRFANEALFAMNVTHKNLIRVYDAGEDPDTHLCYIIMDYMPGGTLAERIRAKGRLGIAEAVKIAVKVASALEVAHRAGMVHRDIKPDNIMFDDDGEPRLADLGIAKFSSGVTNATMTKTEMIVGTPTYMAPEQMMDSHHVDARADIYSLGMVLYEMLTGSRPREGSTVIELLAKAVKGEELPSVCTMRPEVSAAVGYVVSRMTASKADARPDTAIAAAKMLHDAYMGKLKTPTKQFDTAMKPANGGGTMVARGLGTLAATVLIGAVLIALAMVWTKPRSPGAEGGAEAAAASPPTVVITNEISKTLYKTIVVTNIVGDANGDAAAVAAHGGNRAAQAEMRDEGAAVAGRKLRKAKLNGVTWHYTVVDGGAVLTSPGGVALRSRPCIEGHGDSALVIPDTLDGMKVKGIGRFAFNGCDGITFVSIPTGVANIDYGAFNACTALRRVRIPSTARMKGSAFSRCTALETIDIDWANPYYKVERGLVYTKDMTGFVKFPPACRTRKIVFPRTLTKICEDAFADCPMGSFSVPNTIREIEHGAFSRCSRLKSITFTGEVESIGAYAFGKSALKSITIPRGVKEIVGETFRDCASLEEIKFPETLERIGGSAIFEGCKSLKRIEFAGNAPVITGEHPLFPERGVNATIFVKRGSKGWKGAGSDSLPETWPLGEANVLPIYYMFSK